MQANFRLGADETPLTRILLDIPPNSQPDREAVKLLAIGSRKGIAYVIHLLHVKNFAEAGAWSPLMSAPKPGDLMSILTIHIPVT